MTALVLDCSFAVHLGLPDEGSSEAEHFLGKLSADTVLWVPSLWWYEISNSLLTAERRGRLTEAESLSVLELYRSLPLETDSASGLETIWRLQSLGRGHDLSAYDAAYLELAARRELPLATLDRALARAARKAGIKTVLP